MAATSKRIIAVDIDDVLASSTESLRLEVNKRLGVNLLPEHYLIPGDYQGHYQRVWEKHGLSDRISLRELEPAMQTNQEHVPANLNARKSLKALSKRYRLIIITSRRHSWRSATEAWLTDRFPGIFSAVYFTDEVPKGSPPKTKGELCIDHHAQWLIDDNVDHALTAHELGVGVILFGNYGWHHKAPEHITRCKDWAAVLEFFNGH